MEQPQGPYAEQLAALLRQEQQLQFTQFTNETAYEIGTRIIAKAFAENKKVAVDIRLDGLLLFHAKMDGTTDNNDWWINRKNNTVHHYGHSSYYMHVYLKSVNDSVERQGLDPEKYAAEGGAFPLILQERGIAGTISVSGLPGEEDHAMVAGVLGDYLRP